MHIHTRNVNTSFNTFVSMLHTGEYQSEDGAAGRLHGMKLPIVRRQSRNGPVIMIDEPVTITYSHPRERVLFNAARDANPFFHLYHSLWMLAGRDDVAPLAHYVKGMVRYSDDGETLNGAYGHRWRKAVTHQQYYDNVMDDNEDGTDQLKVIINHLKADPNSRRAVLTMWNVEDDLLKIGPGEETSKDVCCNLNVMFSIRETARYDSQEVIIPEQYGVDRFLDMTVTNRSNDMIWGMLGEDYCTFTFLQEYVAAHLGIEVGRYHHFTNNLHAYESNWKPEEWLESYMKGDYPSRVQYQDGPYSPIDKILPNHVILLVKDSIAFDEELPRIVDKDWGDAPRSGEWSEPFFATVVDPMLRAHYTHKSKDYDAAMSWCEKIAADDWRIVCQSWITRRTKR